MGLEKLALAEERPGDSPPSLQGCECPSDKMASCCHKAKFFRRKSRRHRRSLAANVTRCAIINRGMIKSSQPDHLTARLRRLPYSAAVRSFGVAHPQKASASAT